jgi:hypothetical protein
MIQANAFLERGAPYCHWTPQPNQEHIMTYRIYGIAKTTRTLLLDSFHKDYTEAIAQAKESNNGYSEYEFSVVPESVVSAARQETERWFAEQDIPNPDDDEFYTKHMEFIETFITIGALTIIGSTVFEAF